jgi:hypothetical protein
MQGDQDEEIVNEMIGETEKKPPEVQKKKQRK